MKITFSKVSWFGFGVVSILFAVVGVFTIATINRDLDALSFFLTERGATVLTITERVLLANRLITNPEQIQAVAAEIAEGTGFSFLILTDEKGNILVHSDPKYLSQSIEDITPQQLDRLNISFTPQWRMLEIDGEQFFTVYKQLYFPSPPLHAHGRPEELFAPDDIQNTVIYAFIGHSGRAYNSSTTQSLRTLVSGGGGIFIVAAVLFVILHYVHRNKELQKSQTEAQNLAQEMVGKVQELEADLRQKEKLAAIGDLTAGVAHELRNPLSSIKGYATFFKQKFESGSNEEKAAKIMIEEVERLNRAIDDLIGVGRSSEVKLQPTDITEICNKVCFLLEADALQKHVTLDCLCKDAKPIFTNADPDRLRQAIINITLNAMEAFENKVDTEKRVSLEIEESESTISISIEDNGDGIDQNILSRIFDPYFTTKTKGTGLGLVMAKNIVEAHKGKLEVQSSPDGTIMEIVLPKV